MSEDTTIPTAQPEPSAAERITPSVVQPGPSASPLPTTQAPQPPADEIDPKTGIHTPTIAPVVYVDTVILKGSGEYSDGELFTDVVYRAPKRLWLTDMKGTVEGFKAWMCKHDPRLRTAVEFNVALVREEMTDANKVAERPAL